MKRIYWKWCEGKYEFHFDTGEEFLFGLTRMITINIIRGKVSNKRGRLKHSLFNPPKDAVIGVGETTCCLDEQEKKRYIDLEEDEVKKLLKTYNIIDWCENRTL